MVKVRYSVVRVVEARNIVVLTGLVLCNYFKYSQLRFGTIVKWGVRQIAEYENRHYTYK